MIPVTRLNNERLYINEDKIEFIEEIPDTIISFESGKKVVVQESASTLIEMVRVEKARVMTGKMAGYTPHPRATDDSDM